MRILALETSCDETAAAIVEDGRKILSNAVFSQIDIHALYGGVVPEIASRAHVDACDRMIDQALREAALTIDDIDALAVTYGPGLVGALLIGVNCMKGFSYATGKRLIPVNHIEGHVSANFLSHPELTPPFVCLVVSGGHSHLVIVNDYGVYTLLGQTVDDAAGEAFDKGARVLGLQYPGGPHLSKLAEGGDPAYLKLPRPKAEGKYDFSFSGLKTAFINACHTMEQKGLALPRADLAASYQQAIVDSLCDKTMRAVTDSGLKTLCLAGGVSANALLRRQMAALAQAQGVTLCMPRHDLCTDNAAMIAAAAYYRRQTTAPLSLNAVPSLKLV
ncbi:MAG TPA: tRNA (adenosine(37)-N6)-threonylcarbamoyltransferase complex transferase subunit TsaD [Candidatus Limiplasma sp.]|nr:tRNA (adenosine(37)-N6)-threonylcarbamoyltransferase complex transferase subunit TsaD [Candidatus Limiplasma sp.]